MARDRAKTEDVFQFFVARGFQVCEEEASGLVHLSRDCSNGFLRDDVAIHRNLPYLSQKYIETLLAKVEIPASDFWPES